MAETKITVPAGVPQVTVEREFDAPAELLLRVHLDPELLKQWLGPRDLTLSVDRYETHNGGTWRYVQRDPAGNEHGFHGVFHGEPSIAGIVQTFEYEGAPGHVKLDTTTFKESEGKTLLRTVSSFQSVDDRDAMVASGMERGLRDSGDRLGALLVNRSGRSCRTRATVLDWGLRIVLAVFFAAAAIPKLANVHSSAHMFAEIGAGHWLQYFVGTAELAGAIGLLIPPLTGLAATGLCLDMIGASVVNVTVLHSGAVVLTLVLALVFAVLACRHVAVKWLRNQRQSAASGPTKSPQQSHERLDELLAALQADTDM